MNLLDASQLGQDDFVNENLQKDDKEKEKKSSENLAVNNNKDIDFVSDKDNESNKKKPTIRTYFEYRIVNDMKFGKCLLCDKDLIKMKSGNTSGLKLHLLRNHKTEHDKVYTKEISKSQKKIDIIIKVSKFIF